ncbi:MAG: DUF4418 family protein [Chloroflexi bacterium]|nr:DUF4418 family protein [Chloroflexota bacterium]
MKAAGVLMIALAIAVAVVSLVFNCQAEGRSLALANGTTVPMKCFWSAMAEIAVAVPLLGVGGMLALSQGRETQRTLAVTGGILGAFTMLIPTVLIGVCANPDHDCNRIMLPTTLMAGTLIIAVSLITLFISEGRTEASAA